MRATVLVDNINGAGLCGEWGLCIHIEHDGHVILLDTGASDLFVKNAGALGLDLAAVDYGVLSHAHYDHADGMGAFFAANDRADFYLRAGAAENCFAIKANGLEYIGIRRGTLKEYRERIVFAEGVHELYPGAWLLPHTTPGLDEIGAKAGMYVKEGLFHHRRPDGFAHEQTLVLALESGGLAVLSSCSHGGVSNILREVRTAFPSQTVRALIGGFHLYQTEPEEVRALGRDLASSGVETIVTGHCTGQEAYELLREELGGDVRQMYAGMTLEF